MKRCAVTLVAFAMLLAGGTATAGSKAKPRPGTYAGAGSMVGDATYGMELGFSFDGTTADVSILGFSQPGCNGYTTVAPATVAKRRFKATGSNLNRAVVLKGKWVEPGKLKGRMTMTVPPMTNCGTPGTYVYKYGAKRYGGQ